MANSHGRFVWYELMTTDVEAAKAFYAEVVGWGELDAPGRVGWHELLAADWEKAFAFYRELFGWQKAQTDTGAVGTYQLFSAGGQTIGGMFTKPPTMPVPFWLYYFNIGDIDLAMK